MKLKAVAIVAIIGLSLLPIYLLNKYLQKRIRPRESLQKFLLWVMAMLVIIFGYTFLLVLTIQLLFPVQRIPSEELNRNSLFLPPKINLHGL